MVMESGLNGCQEVKFLYIGAVDSYEIQTFVLSFCSTSKLIKIKLQNKAISSAKFLVFAKEQKRVACCIKYFLYGVQIYTYTVLHSSLT